MLRNYDDVEPLILSGASPPLSSLIIPTLNPASSFSNHSAPHHVTNLVPEEQEVSIEFVVNSVVRALERNREARRASDPSLPPFNVKIEVRPPSVDV